MIKTPQLQILTLKHEHMKNHPRFAKFKVFDFFQFFCNFDLCEFQLILSY